MYRSDWGRWQGREAPFLEEEPCRYTTHEREIHLSSVRFKTDTHHSAGAPGIPLPADGTITAFLSSVSVSRHSRSWDSLSTSSSDLSTRSQTTRHFINLWHLIRSRQTITCARVLPCLQTSSWRRRSRYSWRLVRAVSHCALSLSRSTSWS